MQDVLTEFLKFLFTSTKYGINFYDRTLGLYNTTEANQSSDGVKANQMKNYLIFNSIISIKPEGEKMNDFLLSVFKVCPDLIQSYFKYKLNRNENITHYIGLACSVLDQQKALIRKKFNANLATSAGLIDLVIYTSFVSAIKVKNLIGFNRELCLKLLMKSFDCLVEWKFVLGQRLNNDELFFKLYNTDILSPVINLDFTNIDFNLMIEFLLAYLKFNEICCAKQEHLLPQIFNFFNKKLFKSLISYLVANLNLDYLFKFLNLLKLNQKNVDFNDEGLFQLFLTYANKFAGSLNRIFNEFGQLFDNNELVRIFLLLLIKHEAKHVDFCLKFFNENLLVNNLVSFSNYADNEFLADFKSVLESIGFVQDDKMEVNGTMSATSTLFDTFAGQVEFVNQLKIKFLMHALKTDGNCDGHTFANLMGHVGDNHDYLVILLSNETFLDHLLNNPKHLNMFVCSFETNKKLYAISSTHIEFLLNRLIDSNSNMNFVIKFPLKIEQFVKCLSQFDFAGSLIAFLDFVKLNQVVLTAANSYDKQHHHLDAIVLTIKTFLTIFKTLNHHDDEQVKCDADVDVYLANLFSHRINLTAKLMKTILEKKKMIKKFFGFAQTHLIRLYDTFCTKFDVNLADLCVNVVNGERVRDDVDDDDHTYAFRLAKKDQEYLLENFKKHNKSLNFLKISNLNLTEFLSEQVDEASIKHSISNYPINRKLTDLDTDNLFRIKDCVNSEFVYLEKCYDPIYLLPNFYHLLNYSELKYLKNAKYEFLFNVFLFFYTKYEGNFVDLPAFISSKCLSYILVSLSSKCNHLRAIAYASLYQFYQHLQGMLMHCYSI
jgi:hypothetical protein